MGRNDDLFQEIARQAFYLYTQRGFVDGNDLDDWLRAERMVTEQSSKVRVKRSSGKAKKTQTVRQ
jgi:Protein of unknown function (DUF2934)